MGGGSGVGHCLGSHQIFFLTPPNVGNRSQCWTSAAQITYPDDEMQQQMQIPNPAQRDYQLIYHLMLIYHWGRSTPIPTDLLWFPLELCQERKQFSCRAQPGKKPVAICSLPGCKKNISTKKNHKMLPCVEIFLDQGLPGLKNNSCAVFEFQSVLATKSAATVFFPQFS